MKPEVEEAGTPRFIEVGAREIKVVLKWRSSLVYFSQKTKKSLAYLNVHSNSLRQKPGTCPLIKTDGYIYIYIWQNLGIIP